MKYIVYFENFEGKRVRVYARTTQKACSLFWELHTQYSHVEVWNEGVDKTNYIMGLI